MTPYFARLAQRAGAESRPSPAGGRQDARVDGWSEQVEELATASGDSAAGAANAALPHSGAAVDNAPAALPVGRAEAATATAKQTTAFEPASTGDDDLDAAAITAGMASTFASPTAEAVVAASRSPAFVRPATVSIAPRPEDDSYPPTAASSSSPMHDAIDDTRLVADGVGGKTAPARGPAERRAVAPSVARPASRAHESRRTQDPVAAAESHDAATATELATTPGAVATAARTATAQPRPPIAASHDAAVPALAPRATAPKSTGIEVSIGRVDIEIVGAPAAPRSAMPAPVVAPSPAAAAPRAGFNARRHYLRGG